MTTLANTSNNNAKIKALGKIKQTKWVGNTIHSTMSACLVAINLNSENSGHYNPMATQVNSLTGWYMINQDGSLFCEARVIKEDDKKYKIEYLTNDGWNEFEELYSKFIDEE